MVATGGICVLQSATTIVKFVDIPVPVISVNGSTAICEGQAVLLTTPVTTFFTEWQLDGVPIAGAANPTLSVSNPGSYRVRNYFPASGGCSVMSAPVNISSIPLPDASLNTTGFAICFGEHGTITHVPSAGETYTWYKNNVLIAGETNNVLDVNTAGNYKLNVLGANGCYNSSANVVVTVNPLPVAVLDPADTVALCEGGILSIRTTPLNLAEYTWYHGTQQQSISGSNILNVTQGGTYHVKIRNTITGCTNTSEETFVTTYAPPPILASNDTIIAMNQPYTLNVHGITNVQVDHYEWEPSTGLNDPSIYHPTTTLTHDQEYLVKAFYPSGCFATDKVLIRVLKGPAFYIPSAFSPNEDSRNDLLQCIAVGIKSFKYFDIYNRYGQRIFNTANLSTGWDGKWKGRQMDTGTYVYLAEGTDFSGKNVIAKGTVTIFY
jgi:gliding motility-associated-like protein